jgi:hypothetical protein
MLIELIEFRLGGGDKEGAQKLYVQLRQAISRLDNKAGVEILHDENGVWASVHTYTRDGERVKSARLPLIVNQLFEGLKAEEELRYMQSAADSLQVE